MRRHPPTRVSRGAEIPRVEGADDLRDRLWRVGGGRWHVGRPSLGRGIVATIRAGFDLGIDWVDTAEVYGDGRSEEIIGRVDRRSSRGDDVHESRVGTSRFGL